MRYLIILMAIIAIGSSCSTMKSSSNTASVITTSTHKKSASTEFIETITITPVKTNETVAAPPLKKETTTTSGGEQSSIEFASPALLKYAILMNAPVEELNNERLIQFIDDWYG